MASDQEQAFILALKGDFHDVTQKLRALGAQLQAELAGVRMNTKLTSAAMAEMNRQSAATIADLTRQQRTYVAEVKAAEKAQIDAVKNLATANDTWVKGVVAGGELMKKAHEKESAALQKAAEVYTAAQQKMAASLRDHQAALDKSGKLEAAHTDLILANRNAVERKSDAYDKANLRLKAAQEAEAKAVAGTERATLAKIRSEAATVRSANALEQLQRAWAALTKSEQAFTDNKIKGIKAQEEHTKAIDAGRFALAELNKEFGKKVATAKDTRADEIDKIQKKIAEYRASLAAVEAETKRSMQIEGAAIATLVPKIAATTAEIDRAKAARIAEARASRAAIDDMVRDQGRLEASMARVRQEQAKQTQQQHDWRRSGQQAGVIFTAALAAGAIAALAGGGIAGGGVAAIAVALVGGLGVALSNSVGPVFRNIGVAISGIVSGIGSVISSLTQILTRGAATVIGFGATIVGLGRQVGEAANALRTLATVSGMTVREATGLQQVFSTVGGASFVFQAALSGLIDKAGAGEQAFVRMGVATKDQNNNLLPATRILENISIAYANAANKQDFLANASKVFGSWMTGTMMPIIAAGPGKLRELTNAYEKLGLTWDDLSQRKGERVHVALNLIQGGFAAIARDLIVGLEPVFTRVAELFLTNLPKILDWVTKIAKAIEGLASGFLGELFKFDPSSDVAKAATTAVRGLDEISRSGTTAMTTLGEMKDEAKQLRDEINRLDRALHAAVAPLKALQQEQEALIRSRKAWYDAQADGYERQLRAEEAILKQINREHADAKELIDDIIKGLQRLVKAEQDGAKAAKEFYDRIKEEAQKSLRKNESDLRDLRDAIDLLKRPIQSVIDSERDLVENLRRDMTAATAGWREELEAVGEVIKGLQAQQQAALDALGDTLSAIDEQITDIEEQLAALEGENEALGDNDEQQSAPPPVSVAPSRVQRLLALQMGWITETPPELPIDDQAAERAARMVAIEYELTTARQALSDATNQLARDFQGELSALERAITADQDRLRLLDETIQLEAEATRQKKTQLQLEDLLGTSELGRLRQEKEGLQDIERVVRRKGETQAEFAKRLRISQIDERMKEIGQERQLADLQEQQRQEDLKRERDQLKEQLDARIAANQEAATAIEALWQAAQAGQEAAQEEVNRLVEEQAGLVEEQVRFQEELAAAMQAQRDWAAELIEIQGAARADAESGAKTLKELNAEAAKALKQRIKGLRAQGKALRKEMEATRKAYNKLIAAEQKHSDSLQRSIELSDKGFNAQIAAHNLEIDRAETRLRQIDTTYKPRVDALEARIEQDRANVQTVSDANDTVMAGYEARSAALGVEIEGRRADLETLDDRHKVILRAHQDTIEGIQATLENLRQQEKDELGPLQAALETTRLAITSLSEAATVAKDELHAKLDLITGQFDALSETIGVKGRNAGTKWAEMFVSAVSHLAGAIGAAGPGDPEDPNRPQITDDAGGFFSPTPRGGQVESRWATLGKSIAEQLRKAITNEDGFWTGLGKTIGDMIAEGLRTALKEAGKSILDSMYGELDPRVREFLHRRGVGPAVEGESDTWIGGPNAPPPSGTQVPTSRKPSSELVGVANAMGTFLGATLGAGVQDEFIRFLSGEGESYHPGAVRSSWEAYAKAHSDYSLGAFKKFEEDYRKGIREWTETGAAEAVKKASVPESELKDWAERVGTAAIQAFDGDHGRVARELGDIVTRSMQEGVDQAERELPQAEPKVTSLFKSVGSLFKKVASAVIGVAERTSEVSTGTRDAAMAGIEEGLTAAAAAVEGDEKIGEAAAALAKALGEELTKSLQTPITDALATIDTALTDWWAKTSLFFTDTVKPWDIKAVQDNWQAWADGIGDQADSVYSPDGKGRNRLRSWWEGLKAFFTDEVKPWEALKENAFNLEDQLFGSAQEETGAPQDLSARRDQSHQRNLKERVTGIFPEITKAIADWITKLQTEVFAKFDPAEWTKDKRKAFHDEWLKVFTDLAGEGGIPRVMAAILTGLATDAGRVWSAMQPGMEAAAQNTVSTLDQIVKIVNDLANQLLAESNVANLAPLGEIPGRAPLASTPVNPTAYTPAAAGGLFPATTGGRRALLAEGGYDEAVITSDPRHVGRTKSLVGKIFSRLGMGGPEDPPAPVEGYGGAMTPTDVWDDSRGLSRRIPRAEELTDFLEDRFTKIAGSGVVDRIRDMTREGQNNWTTAQTFWQEAFERVTGGLAAGLGGSQRPAGGQMDRVRQGSSLTESVLGISRVADWMRALQEFASPFAWPALGVITQPFGVNPERYGAGGHPGIDIANNRGTPITAPAFGVISSIDDTGVDDPNGLRGGYGYHMRMAHSRDVETLYGHLIRGSATKAVGETARAGETIGLMDSTGASTGDHLHWETRIKGALRDPLGELNRFMSVGQVGDDDTPVTARASDVLGSAQQYAGMLPAAIAALIKEIASSQAYNWANEVIYAQAIAGYESTGRVGVRNAAGSSATGLFQLTSDNWNYLPRGTASFGNARDEVIGGLSYIRDRYQNSPLRAWQFEMQHGWYDEGGIAGLNGPEMAHFTRGREAVIDPATTEALHRKGLISFRKGSFPEVAPELAAAAMAPGQPFAAVGGGRGATYYNDNRASVSASFAQRQRTPTQEEAYLRAMITDVLRRN